MITRLLTAATAAAAVAVLAGCGPASNSGNTGASSGNQNNPKAKAALSCDLAPASMVNTALGTSVGNPSAQTDVDNVVVCTYSPTSGIGTVILRIQTDRAPADFTAARGQSDAQGIKTADLPGFEDNAYTSTISAAGITTNTVVALKGTVEILVSSPASFDQEKTLEQQLFGKLG